MADFGRTDFYAPDSNLDSDPNDPGLDYVCADGGLVNVKVNDWLDLADEIPSDPNWGSSFQVYELQPELVIVRMYNPSADLYAPVAVSPSYITNNYRRVPRSPTP